MRRCRSLITSEGSDASNVIAVSLMTELEQTIAVTLHRAVIALQIIGE